MTWNRQREHVLRAYREQAMAVRGEVSSATVADEVAEAVRLSKLLGAEVVVSLPESIRPEDIRRLQGVWAEDPAVAVLWGWNPDGDTSRLTIKPISGRAGAGHGAFEVASILDGLGRYS